MKRTPLKRGKSKLKRNTPLRSDDGRDWTEMGTVAHRNVRGECEWCEKPLPLGTPPAHIIPRDKKHPELDEPWNLALMGYVKPCTCHTKFDLDRVGSFEKMKAEGAPLAKRIESDPRLSAYFKRRAERRDYIRKSEEGLKR